MLCDDVRLQSDVRLGTTAGCRVHGTCLLVRGTGWVIRINGNQAGVCKCRSACVLFLHAFGQHSGLAVRVFTGSTLPGSSQAASACRAPHFVCCSQLLASACLYVVCLFACSLLQQGGMHVQRYRAVIGSWSGPQLAVEC